MSFLENYFAPDPFQRFHFEQCEELGGRGGRMVIIDQTGVCVCVCVIVMVMTPKKKEYPPYIPV